MIFASRLGLAALSGVLYAVAFPDAGLSLLVFVSLAPLLAALRDAGPRRSAFLAFVHGVFAFGIGIYWIREVSLPGLFLLVAILSLYTALFGALSSLASGMRPALRIPVVSLVWIACDALRLHLFSGFPFLFPAYALYEHLPLIQAADLAGFEGISFAVVATNALVEEAVHAARGRRRGRAITLGAAAALVPLALFLYGTIRLAGLDLEKGPRCLAVQPNVPQGAKHDSMSASEIWRSQVLLTMEGMRAAGPVDLVSWAETMYPFRIDDNRPEEKARSLALLGGDVARRHGTSFLVGANAIGAGDADDRSYSHRAYNRAYLFDSAGELKGTYDKQHLVPSGEFVPLRGYLPFQDAIDDYVASVNGFFPNLTAGEETTVFEIPTRSGPRRFAALICYESLFPYLSREARRGGADFLVNISNDGWWRGSSQLEQCVAISAFRAVETRMAVFRATNTGISCWIDPRGAVRERLVRGGIDREVAGTLFADLEICASMPPAVAVGGYFAPVAGGLGVLAAALSYWGLRRRRPNDAVTTKPPRPRD